MSTARPALRPACLAAIVGACIFIGAATPPEAAPEPDWEKLRHDHWAFRALEKPEPPAVRDPTWAQNPIDRFVLAKLEASDMRPARPAQRRLLIRRAFLDLIGLPPTPEQVEDFLRDASPDALAKVVDPLLHSPQYGERWGRHWLDVARYSDGFGSFLDPEPLPDAWRYRDWVVQAFNRDLSYDQFVQQQIAGDRMDQPDSVLATGFFAVGPTYRSDGGDPDATAQAKAETLADRVDTLSRAFLALTVQCSRCHDHPFDPIPQMDYYSIAGVFNNSETRLHPLAPAAVVKRYNESRKAIRAQEERIKKWINAQKKANGGKMPEGKKPKLERMRAELARLRKSAPPRYPAAHTLVDSGKADMPVALRGNLRTPGELAPRRFLRVLAVAGTTRFVSGSGRLELARAVASRDNALTARVMVNRIWQYHFGQGIVRTSSNFGALGEKPTHPRLLDWLAATFVESGWSIKHLHRVIMLSNAYRMSSRFDESHFAKDGDNRLLWRMSPRRLEVEAWRDSVLAVTGEFDTAIGGKPTDKLLRSRRRTLYTTISRNGDRFASDALLRLFDFPAPRTSAAKRTTSTVPQQYLFLLNSPFMRERARVLAGRLAREAPDDESRIDRGYALLYARPPTPDEKRVGLAFLAAKGEGPPQWQQYAQVLLCAHEFTQIQ